MIRDLPPLGASLRKTKDGRYPQKIHKRIVFWIDKYNESWSVGMTMEVSSKGKVPIEAESN